MYYRSPCLFFRNIVRSASSCFRVRQDHYGARGLWPDHARARGLWPDHARARGLWPDHACARGLTRPLSDHSSGTSSLASHARGLPRPLSDHGSGTSSLAPRPVLGDCLDHSPTTARGLRRSLLDLCSGTARLLSDHGSGTLRLDYMRLATHIQLGYFFSLRPCYKAHTSPSSKLGDYISTMHLLAHLVSLVRRFVSQLN